MRRLALALAAVALAEAAGAATVEKRVDTADEGVLIVSCDAGPIVTDYVAETASGVAPTDPYAVERGVDKGLVRRIDQGGRRAKRFTLSRRQIRAMVRVKADAAEPDWTDLLFTPQALVVVRVQTSNAGVFTDADVYRLPYTPAGVDIQPAKGEAELMDMLKLGLAAYDRSTGRCAR